MGTAWVHEAIHDVGFMMLDVRAGKTFLRGGVYQKRPFLGDPQWKAMELALASGGSFDAVKSLVVLSPVPVAFLSPTMTNLIAKGSLGAADDLEGLWTGNGVKELPTLLEMLYSWKCMQPDREVTIVAGDIHIGLHTKIMRRGLPVFHQVT